MRAETWSRISGLMDGALAVPAGERSAWISEQAQGDPEIVAEVERLLSAHDAAGGFLLEPAMADPAAAAAIQNALAIAEADTLAAGSELGHYRVIRTIGHGGMGTVYLAARADEVFEKQVAIKVTRGARADEALRARFTRERQILATLDHPGIARVLDGGATAGGVQYLVMEYVDGTPIHDYCETHRLDTASRLQLFVEVCRAVQYAHDRLIVHCDIKAANVLVGRDGHARLVDFGIARLLAPEAPTAESSAVRLQAWTPESASPEQVRGEPSTVSTDVYGLGALLYRLLTGTPVFDLSRRDAIERARVICEAAPAPPSAAARPADSGHRPSAVSADLDAIALKALHKEPAERYRSAGHLAEDIERCLASRPVMAAPDRWQYRTRKFVARHPFATSATAVALLAVLTATSAALWQARRADLERDRAQARLADVRRLANTLIFDLYDRLANTPNATPMRRSMVEQGIAYLDRLAADAGADTQVILELAEAYLRLAQVQGAKGLSNLGDREGAVSSLEKGRAVLAGLRASGTAPLEIELTDLRLLGRLASIVTDDQSRARALGREGIERTDRLLQRYPDRTDVIGAAATAHFDAALVADSADTLALWTRANQLYGDLVGRRPGNANALRNLALTEKYIGSHHHGVGRLDLAQPHYERALALDRQVQQLRPDDRTTAMDLAFDLGNVAAVAWGATPPDLPRAAALYQESLALRERASAQDPQDVFARQSLGYVLMQLSDVSGQRGNVEAALDYARRSSVAYESLPASQFPARRGRAWYAHGLAARRAGHEAEACQALRRAQQNYTTAAAVSPAERRMLPADALATVSGALRACAPSATPP